MPDDPINGGPVDAGLVDADLGGMSDEQALDAVIAKNFPDAEASDAAPEAAVEEPIIPAEPVEKDDKPVEDPAKPAEKVEDQQAKPDDKQDAEPAEDDVADGLTVGRLQSLQKSNAEFKALLEKHPELRGQFYGAARRAERANQYDELFQTPALAKEAKTAAEEAYFSRDLYTNPQQTEKFWRKLQWDDMVKDDQGRPVRNADGTLQMTGNYDRVTSAYRQDVYNQLDQMVNALESKGQTFKDKNGTEVSHDDLRVALHVMRALTQGTPIPMQPVAGPDGKPVRPEAPKLPDDVQRELEELRARDSERQQNSQAGETQFKQSVDEAAFNAVQGDIKSLLTKRLPANAAVSDYLKDTIVRDTVAEVLKAGRENAAHQSVLVRALQSATRDKAGSDKVIAIQQAFAKELIPKILSRVIAKAVPGVTANSQQTLKKVEAQTKRKEVASSGGVSTPSRPDARQVAKDAVAKAKSQGKDLSDMELLDAVLEGTN